MSPLGFKILKLGYSFFLQKEYFENLIIFAEFFLTLKTGVYPSFSQVFCHKI